MANGFFIPIEGVNNIFLGTDVKGFDGAGADSVGVGGQLIFQKQHLFLGSGFFELIHFGQKVLIIGVGTFHYAEKDFK